MNKILVPLDQYYELAHNACYYAIELAKRTDARVFFLFVSEARLSPVESSNGPWKDNYEKMKEKIGAFIEQGRQRPVVVEYHSCIGDYVNIVCDFAKNHKISKIVVAKPDKDDLFSERMRKNIDRLKCKVQCQLLVVKPKGKIGETNEIGRDKG